MKVSTNTTSESQEYYPQRDHRQLQGLVSCPSMPYPLILSYPSNHIQTFMFDHYLSGGNSFNV
jgi:hypothetical protein